MSAMFDDHDDDVLDLGSGGAQAAAFNNPGDSVSGVITDFRKDLPQTDMDTGQPKYWPNGEKMTMHRVVLQTDQRQGADDDGKRAVYLRGSLKPETKTINAAVMGAIRAANAPGLKKGGRLTVTYASNGEPTRKGYNPPKQYTAQYVPPPPRGSGAPPSAGGAADQGSPWAQPAGQQAAPPF